MLKWGKGETHGDSWLPLNGKKNGTNSRLAFRENCLRQSGEPSGEGLLDATVVYGNVLILVTHKVGTLLIHL